MILGASPLTCAQKTSDRPNPEQTCSLLSLLLYTFLDKTVYASEAIPEIADYDRAEHLVDRSFKNLDVFSGAKKQHIFFALMRVFSESSLSHIVSSYAETKHRMGVSISGGLDGFARSSLASRAGRH